MKTQRIPILMYHSISTSAQRRFRKFAVDPNQFASHLAYLDKHGYNTVTVTQLANAFIGAFKLPTKPVVLTFDDGYADFYHEAFPRLKRYGFLATLYVTTGFVGETSRWLSSAGEADRPMISWKQLGDVARHGIEIGGHSHTHTPLDTLSTFAACHEIVQCKQLLEDHLTQTITSFAYPYGYYNSAVRRLVENAGYIAACSVRYRMTSTNDDRYSLGRFIVPAGTTANALGQLLSGRPTTQLLSRVRTNAWRFMRDHIPTLRKPPQKEMRTA